MKKVFMDVSKSFNEDLKKINNKINIEQAFSIGI